MKKILVLVLPLLAIFLFVGFLQISRSPVLTSMFPRIGGAGDILVLEGRYFGDGGGDVYIAGQRLTRNSYLEWTNTRISLRIPDGIGSGMVVVENRQGTSNGILFAQKGLVPVSLSPPSVADERRPVVSSSQVRRGQEIQITGSQIGSFPLGSRLVWIQDEGFELELLVRRWEEGRVTFLVPLEAKSGSLRLWKTDGANFDFPMVVLPPRGLVEAPVTDESSESLGFFWTVSYGVSAALNASSRVEPTGSPVFSPLSWLPLPRHTAFQQHQVLRVETPLGGIAYETRSPEGNVHSLVTLEAPSTKTTPPWNHRVEVEVSTTERKHSFVDAQVLANYTGLEELSRPWLGLGSRLLNLEVEDQALFAQTARTIVGRQTNPIIRSRLLFNWVLDRVEPQYVPSSGFPDLGDLLDSLESSDQPLPTSGSLGYSGLLVGLLRGLQIPSRIIEGFLVLDYEELVPHYWVEVLLPEIGWVPMDPGFADGMYDTQSFRGDSPRTYYFGNLDARRIDLGPLGQEQIPSPAEAQEVASWYLRGDRALYPGRDVEFANQSWYLPFVVSGGNLR